MLIHSTVTPYLLNENFTRVINLKCENLVVFNFIKLQFMISYLRNNNDHLAYWASVLLALLWKLNLVILWESFRTLALKLGRG